jgi:hypothetical protein
MVVKPCAVVMVERVGANEGNVDVLTPHGEYRRLKHLQAYEACRGTAVRVREGHLKSQFAGMCGTIQEPWVSSVHGAVDVLLEDGNSRLFWLADLSVVDEEITV